MIDLTGDRNDSLGTFLEIAVSRVITSFAPMIAYLDRMQAEFPCLASSST